MTDNELIELAKTALKNSYSPYSRFKVGAALLCQDGSVFLGCNIENASFGAANCAERTAFFKAISGGKKQFSKIAVVGTGSGEITEFTPPCGICRQVMAEFCDDDFEVVLTDEKTIESFKLSDLLPCSFTKFNIK